MIRAVWIQSVLVKSIFKPHRSLSAESYSRELETHEKMRCTLIRSNDIKTIESKLE